MKRTERHAKRALDGAILILRVGIGVLFIVHGMPKLLGGPETWEQLGGAMGGLGISVAPAFWGFMAAISETLGGLLLAVGLFTRPAAAFLLITMIVATLHHVHQGSAFSATSHPAKMIVVFLALLVSGAGTYALSRHVKRLDEKCWG